MPSGDSCRFGEVDHPRAGAHVVEHNEDGRSDHFVSAEEGGVLDARVASHADEPPIVV